MYNMNYVLNMPLFKQNIKNKHAHTYTYNNTNIHIPTQLHKILIAHFDDIEK